MKDLCPQRNGIEVATMGAHLLKIAGVPKEAGTPEATAVIPKSAPDRASASAPPHSGIQMQTNWEALYQTHADFVWRSLQRMGVKKDDARDALHDVFLIVHQRLHTFDPDLGTERSWLFGIAANVARASARKRRPLLLENTDELAGPSLATGDTRGILTTARPSHYNLGSADTVDLRRLRENLEAAVAALDPERRAVFVMFELEGIGCVDIADELGVPLGTVYSRLHSARKQLRDALSAHRPEAEGALR